MLNLFLYHLASGDAWFSSGLLFLLAMTADFLGVLVGRGRLGAWLGIVLFFVMVLAGVTATPLPLWLAIPLVVLCVAYLDFGFARPRLKRRKWLEAATGALIVASLVHEASYRWAQPPQAPRPATVYIIGDSLAAGMGGELTTWPKLLAERSGIDIRDLSFPGATTRTALQKLRATLGPGDAPQGWILINIGGNDMLGSTTAGDFGDDLDQLLAAACGGSQRVVLMQELPLIPGAWAFGAHQRRLAAKYDVVLIPKYLVAEVIFTESNVLDGLHLSPAGHERMAELLLPWLQAS